jgi:hypothetical protein
MRELTRRQLSVVIIVLVLIRGLELASAVRWMDQEQYISQRRLEVAMLTTYHSPDRGEPTTLSVDNLGEYTIIAQPAKCVPLAVAPTDLSQVTDAMAWWGTVGDNAQWVNLLTLRFNSADDARWALLSKRVALLRCPLIRATFPPFDELSEFYRVSDHSPISPLRWNRVRYTLSGTDSYYDFYVRQFANTVTWTWGSADKSSTGRAQAVDSLVGRLRELGGAR